MRNLIISPLQTSSDPNSQFTAVLPNSIVERVLTEDHFKTRQALNLVSGAFVHFNKREDIGDIIPYLFWTGDADMSHLGWSFPENPANPEQPHTPIGTIDINLVITRGPLNRQGKQEMDLWQIEDVNLLPSFEGLFAKSNNCFIGPPDKWPFVWAFKGKDGTTGVIKIEKVQDRT